MSQVISEILDRGWGLALSRLKFVSSFFFLIHLLGPSFRAIGRSPGVVP